MRIWLTILGCAAFLAGCSSDTIGTSASAAAQKPVETDRLRPNVLLILADDLGYADVSLYHAGRIPTPNIDRLGRQGAMFRQGYVTAPICSPSRAGLMTGRHQQRFGFEYNNGPAARDIRDHLGLDTNEKTLADILRGAGYHTGVIGKWHLGSSPEHYPLARGFDEFWGFLTGQTNYIDPKAPDAVNAGAIREGNDGQGELARPTDVVKLPNAIVTGPDRQRVDLGQGYLPEQMAQQAIGFIDRNRAQPFFLYLAFNAPHTPLQTTRKYYDRFPNIADKDQRVYAGMVSALDDAVGAVLDHLDRTGQARNTIVLLMSDNGCAAYVAGICSNEPLSGGKLTYLEGGVRVPFLVRWPAQIMPGMVIDRPVSTLDIAPTLAAAAGTALPSDRRYDGFDLMSVIKGTAAPRPPLFWRTNPMLAARDGDWKYLRDLDGVEFLYNIRRDPHERRDLAKLEPAKLAAMRSELAAWNQTLIAPKWQGRSTEYDFGGRHFKFSP